MRSFIDCSFHLEAAENSWKLVIMLCIGVLVILRYYFHPDLKTKSEVWIPIVVILTVQASLERIYVSGSSLVARWTDKFRFVTRGQEAVLKGYKKVECLRPLITFQGTEQFLSNRSAWLFPGHCC